MNPRRGAGLGFLCFGLGTAIAFMTIGSPGGDYQQGTVVNYIGGGHWAIAFLISYLGAFASLALIAFGRGVRDELGRSGDTVWGLCVAGAATSVAGWFVVGGLDVAMAEGGSTVQTGVEPTVVYMISEIGNLLAVCGPALCVGVAAIVLALRAPLPGWLRAFSLFAGVCGVLAPAFFTLFIFLIWVVVFGARMALTRATAPVGMQTNAPSVV